MVSGPRASQEEGKQDGQTEGQHNKVLSLQGREQVERDEGEGEGECAAFRHPSIAEKIISKKGIFYFISISYYFKLKSLEVLAC